MSGENSRSESPWPSFALPRGTIVNGYRLEQVLGSGGFGITYLALDLLQQRFAIKEYYPRQFAVRQDMTVRPTSAEDAELFEECRERFLREAQALVLLGRVAGASDGIVRAQTYFEAYGTCFLVMDYIEGASLAAVLRQTSGGMPPARVRSLLLQLLSSIRIVHHAGLMHRDIKPANIILRSDDRLVLIDFGATREATRGDATSYTQIYSGGYAPPEQMLGLRQGEFSDIYAIGAVCYRAIGGTLVDALARQNALAAGRPDPQPSASQIGAGRYPRSLLTTIDAALAVNAAQRPANVDAMLKALGADESAGEPTMLARGRTVPARARARYGIFGTVAGVSVLALVGATYFLLRSPVTPTVAPHQEATVAVPAVPSPAGDTVPPVATTTDASPASPPPQPPAQEQPQREAIVVPPPVPAPTPAPIAPSPPEPSPLERAQHSAATLPCSVLNLANGPNGIRVAGYASAGQELDRLLAEVRDVGRPIDSVTRVDRFACAPISTMNAFVRTTWDSAPPALAIKLDQRNVATGAHVEFAVTTALPALYIDLYQSDGSVHHLLHPTQSGAGNRKRVEWTAGPPIGPRLIVAIAAAAPLDFAARPDTERSSDYLAVLQPSLERAPTPVAADLGILMVHAAEPTTAKAPQPRPTNLRSEKCANIVSRVQLGEALSDAEAAALRTECRS
jgi:serine/threonine protein kinase